MKICYVVNNLYGKAGIGRLARRVAFGVESSGHDVFFITENADDYSGTVTEVQMQNFSLGKLGNLFKTLRAIRKQAKKSDVLVCYDVNPYGIWVSIATLFTGTKIIMYTIATYSLLPQKKNFRYWLMKFAYSRATHTLFVSDFVKRKIGETGQKVSRYDIVPVGVDTSSFVPNVTESPYVQKPYIISVGAIKNRKGSIVSLEAFALLRKKYENLTYAIRGDLLKTSYVEKFLQRIKTLDIEDAVVLLPRINDVELSRLYSNAELFLLSPLSTREAIEGFGMVYIEAGSCGIPVVGTTDSGAEAPIIDGVNGFLVNPNPHEISVAMSKIMEDNKLHTKMGKEGILRAQDFTWEKIVQMHLDIYKKILNK